MHSDAQIVSARPLANPRTGPDAAGRSRVLFVVKRIIGGGAERVVVNLARHLCRARFEPHLSTLSIEAYREDLPDDVTIHELKAREMKWAVPQLISLVRRIRPDVILTTLIESNLAVLLAQPWFPAGTKVIVRDSSNPEAVLTRRVPSPFVARRLYRWLYPRADAVVCQSKSMRADFLRLISTEQRKTHQIYNGVDVPLIEKRAVGISPYAGPGPNLLGVGRLDEDKNFSLMLEAFASARRVYPSARLTILGEGPERARLKQQAHSLGIAAFVDFRGFQQNPFPYYRHADFYLQTSKYEGLPNVLLEVLSLGTAAIATPETGATEEIADIAGSVKLVREPGADAFAKGVIEALGQPRPLLRRDAFMQSFSVDRMLAQYESLFDSLAGRVQECTARTEGASGL